MTRQLRMVESTKIIQAQPPVLLASATPELVTLKDYGRITIIISAQNLTTVTGSDVTLAQSTDVAGAGSKALAFDKVWLNNDTAASDALVETAVVSDTFTLDSTDSKNLLAVIEINAESLDTNNGFDVINLVMGDTTAQIVESIYILHDARYKQATPPTAITD